MMQVEANGSPKKVRIALISDGLSDTKQDSMDNHPADNRTVALARALVDLGFTVVVFSHRKDTHSFLGGRPGMQVETIPTRGGATRGEETLADVEKEAEWLEEWLVERTTSEGIAPWQFFEFVVSEGWCAGFLAEKLLYRLRSRVVAQAVERLLSGVAQEKTMEKILQKAYDLGLGEAPAYFLGNLLLNAEGSPATPLLQRARMSAIKFSRLRGSEGGTEADQLVGAVASALAENRDKISPLLQEIMVAETLGQGLLDVNPSLAHWLEREFELIDRHVWISDIHRLKELPAGGRSLRRNARCQEEKAIRQLICDRASAIVVNRLEEAENLLTMFRVPWEQMFFLLPNPEEDFSRLGEKKVELVKFLEEAGVDEKFLAERKVALEYGPAWPARYKERVLEAFSFAVRERPDLVLVMVGGGGEFKKLQAMRDSRAELRNRVILLEEIPDELLPALFSFPDVFVSASELESDDWALVQAAAAGKAIVCTENQPLAVKIFSPEAVVVPSGELFDLARGLLDLLEDPDNLRKRGQLLAEKAGRLDMHAQAKTFLSYLMERGFLLNLPDGMELPDKFRE